MATSALDQITGSGLAASLGLRTIDDWIGHRDGLSARLFAGREPIHQLQESVFTGVRRIRSETDDRAIVVDEIEVGRIPSLVRDAALSLTGPMPRAEAPLPEGGDQCRAGARRVRCPRRSVAARHGTACPRLHARSDDRDRHGGAHGDPRPSALDDCFRRLRHLPHRGDVGATYLGGPVSRRDGQADSRHIGDRRNAGGRLCGGRGFCRLGDASRHDDGDLSVKHAAHYEGSIRGHLAPRIAPETTALSAACPALSRRRYFGAAAS